MDRSNVRTVVLFSRAGGTDEEVLAAAEQYSGRIVPAIGFQTGGWLQQRPGFLDQVESRLRSGRFQWMGELLLRHYAVPELDAPDYDFSPNTALFRRVLDLSARYRVPVTVHNEADPDNVESFRAALRGRPDALVVWAHWCGRATAEITRGFLEQFPNLYCDLGGSGPSRRYGWDKNPIIGEGFVPAWRELFEAFPDRFLAAIDAVDPSHYDHYDSWVAELRDALLGLGPELAQRIATGNAEGLLRRP